MFHDFFLARRMPAPPEEFVAIQVGRLNEAMLVAFSAMEGTSNLKAVDRVVKIVRELDRYHGHGFLAAGRRRAEADAGPDDAVPWIELKIDGTAAYGSTLACSARFVAKDADGVQFEPRTHLFLSPLQRGEDRAERLAVAESLSEAGDDVDEALVKHAPAGPGGDHRPENPAQTTDKPPSAPGRAVAANLRGEVAEGDAPPSIRADEAIRTADEGAAAGSPRRFDARDDVTEAVAPRTPAVRGDRPETLRQELWKA